MTVKPRVKPRVLGVLLPPRVPASGLTKEDMHF